MNVFVRIGKTERVRNLSQADFALNTEFHEDKTSGQSGGGTSTIPRPTAFPSLSLALPYQVPG